MAKYKQYVTVKIKDSYYGIVMNVEKKELDIFYNFVKKIEENFSNVSMKTFAARFAISDWSKIPNTKTIQKIAKQNKCDIIYNINAK